MERVRFRQRLLLEPCTTDDVLYAAFCAECRPGLRDAPEVRHVLRHALAPFPTDLDAFRRCCDGCYRTVRDAVARARLALTDDAFHAWWLSETADPDDPETSPTRGRCLTALVKVAAGLGGESAKRYADLALTDAEAIGDSRLVAEARMWRSSALRALASFDEARAELRQSAAAVKASPWLAALHLRMLGLLAVDTDRHAEALKHLRAAAKLYEKLDRHTAGLLLIRESAVLLLTKEHEASVARKQEALSFLDSRWNPLSPGGDARAPVVRSWDESVGRCNAS